MYCKNCGNEMNENAAVCTNCGAAKGTGKSFCANCGASVNENAAVCLQCGASLTAQGADGEKSEKTKVAAGLLAIFLGHLGIHWFYLGYTTKGVVNIVLTVLSTILCFLVILGGLGVLGFIAIWLYDIITAILIFAGKTKDAKGHVLS